MPEIGLHSLKPAKGSRHRRKRLGRGEGSGLGKTAGRGQKGAGSRSGSKSRPNAEGGQMPIHMRMRKLRGPHMKKSMPFEQFGRTHTQPVNLSDLDRFDDGAEVTPDALREKTAEPFKYTDKGNLATIGRARAVAELPGLKISGFPAWVLWLVIHLWYLIGFQNRLLVLIRWTFSFATHGRGARLITWEGQRNATRAQRADR